ncbi:RNA polymerase sigma factor [Hymenobacter canadensis]|uniref:Sigma-70 family RNA polymerase sigma factor n=1 Tax=Hymenobacter canadensis TaxID=2999067 RepID=A0ABY7LUS5_9BACT|nr:sigma-70 family RNA polymerase sigma factor [Hymenobacter canadensis]WBA44143.1 sigma-70 family RNA polymerase sigma factor [Hymenobacter canadensis]
MRVNNIEVTRELSERTRHDYLLIVAATTHGDEKAYAELLDRYRRPVFHSVRSIVKNPDDADDLTMEVFTKAFRHLPNFNPEYAFGTWLLRIAANHSIDFLRRQKLRTVHMYSGPTHRDGPLEEQLLAFGDPARDPQAQLMHEEKVVVVRQFVDMLPVKYRRLVVRRYFDELSYEELAAELRAPLGTVKAQLHRARELLYGLAKTSKGGL